MTEDDTPTPLAERSDATMSPLYEADPESLSILFDRIDAKLIKNLPHEILDSDIERLVEYYISERQRFVHDQSQFIKPERKRTAPTSSKRSLSTVINEAELLSEF